MTVFISPEDQKKVDELRIALSMAAVDMTEIYTHDVNSRKKKAAVGAQLDYIRKRLDELGITHTIARTQDNARTHNSMIEFFGARV